MAIHKRFYQPKSSARGFTLIEILVSMALLSILAGIGVSLYAITSNSYNRANRINMLRTQGSQVLEQMERSIRSATSVYATVDGTLTGSACTASSSICYLTLSLPSNSIDYQASGANCSTLQYVWIKSIPSSDVNGRLTRTYSNCTITPTPTPNVDLLDTDNVTGASIELAPSLPVFVVNPTVSSNPPTVTLAFTLYEGVKNSKTAPQNRASIPFTSTISLRYN